MVYSTVGTACWYCGYDKGIKASRVLDFHHVDPAKKEFNISAREITMLKWERIIIEIKKCVLLCCRCHREEQIGLINSSEILSIYNKRWSELTV